MVWVRLDDSVPLERRHRQLSASGNWLLFCMLAYTNRELTDGAVDRSELDMVWPGADPKERTAAAAELVKAGAIELTATGWKVVWLIDKQPSAQDVIEKRADDRKRQQEWRKNKRLERESQDLSQRDTASDSQDESQRESQPPVPTRPVPTRPDDLRESPNGDLSNSDKPSSDVEDVRAVFTHWLAITKHDAARTKLTKERRAKIVARLREGYTVDQLKQAIDGCAKSPFHSGDNDRGQRYDDIVTTLKSGSSVEQHIERLTGSATSRGRAAASSDEELREMAARLEREGRTYYRPRSRGGMAPVSKTFEEIGLDIMEDP